MSDFGDTDKSVCAIRIAARYVFAKRPSNEDFHVVPTKTMTYFRGFPIFAYWV
jgi:hypothetical protein